MSTQTQQHNNLRPVVIRKAPQPAAVLAGLEVKEAQVLLLILKQRYSLHPHPLHHPINPPHPVF